MKLPDATTEAYRPVDGHNSTANTRIRRRRILEDVKRWDTKSLGNYYRTGIRKPSGMYGHIGASRFGNNVSGSYSGAKVLYIRYKYSGIRVSRWKVKSVEIHRACWASESIQVHLHCLPAGFNALRCIKTSTFSIDFSLSTKFMLHFIMTYVFVSICQEFHRQNLLPEYTCPGSTLYSVLCSPYPYSIHVSLTTISTFQR